MVVTTTCEGCGEELELEKKGCPRKLYCSPACSTRAYGRKHPEKVRESARKSQRKNAEKYREQRVRKITPEQKAAKAAYRKEYYAKHRDAELARAKKRNANPEVKASRAVYQKEWSAKNRDARAAYQKEYNSRPESLAKARIRDRARSRTPKFRAVRNARYANDADFRERTLATQAERYASDADVRRRALEKSQAWRKNNPERNRVIANASGRKRRARKAAVHHEPYNAPDIFARDGHICGICLLPFDSSDASIDHIIAIDNGGHDAPYNVQGAHGSCNSSKGTKRLRDHWALTHDCP